MNPALAASPGWPPPEFGPAKPDGSWLSPGFRSSWPRSRVLLAMLVVTIAANAIAVVQGLAGFGLIDAAVAGTITSAEGVAYDTMVAVTSVAQAVLYYATGVALFAWLSRVVENIPPLTGYTPRRSPRASIGWWFVPVASWVVPYQIVDDAIVRLRTSPARGAERLVTPWWIALLLMLASSYLPLLAGRGVQTLDALRALITIRVAGDAVYVVGGVLLFLIVRAMEQRSGQRAAALGLGRSAVATWPAASYPQPDPAPGWAASERRLERVDVSPEGPAEPPPPPA
jgi:hypothetical protein